MPIIVKDYSWEETEKFVYITVPLKGVKPAKVDIFSTDEFVKVSYPPYLWECALFGPVYDEKASVKIGGGVVVFQFEKQVAGLWTLLQHVDQGDKEKMKARREAALKLYEQRLGDKAKKQAEDKRTSDKYALKEQMRLEDVERARVENLKETERQTATQMLDDWKQQQKENAKLLKEADKKKKAESAELEEIPALVDERTELKNNKNMFEEDEEEDENEAVNKVKTVKVAPREPGKIAVSFTPRVFPTPSRESQAHDEQEWLKKQADYRRIAELKDKDLSEEEKNPVWLRDKGNEFFKAGNYQAAINAFSHAIRLNFKMPALYSNRGACHLKLGNHMKCVEDCSRALELLTPPVAQNAASRCRAHIRRGTAFCELELYAEGLQDYEASLKIDPKNEQIEQDADRIRNIILGEQPS